MFRISKSLLHYIKLIEVLSYIKTEILSAIRDASAELVVEGILSKKQMKMYFSSLPCSSSTALPTAAMDLKDYTLITLVKLFNDDKDNESSSYLPVNAQDIDSALREMLPVIAREAYFTAALFGLSSNKKLDGREKKKSVDHCSKWIHYYISRICGIASEIGADGDRFGGLHAVPRCFHTFERIN